MARRYGDGLSQSALTKWRPGSTLGAKSRSGLEYNQTKPSPTRPQCARSGPVFLFELKTITNYIIKYLVSTKYYQKLMEDNLEYLL